MCACLSVRAGPPEACAPGKDALTQDRGRHGRPASPSEPHVVSDIFCARKTLVLSTYLSGGLRRAGPSLGRQSTVRGLELCPRPLLCVPSPVTQEPLLSVGGTVSPSPLLRGCELHARLVSQIRGQLDPSRNVPTALLRELPSRADRCVPGLASHIGRDDRG